MQKFREIIGNALMELKLDMEQAYGEIKVVLYFHNLAWCLIGIR